MMAPASATNIGATLHAHCQCTDSYRPGISVQLADTLHYTSGILSWSVLMSVLPQSSRSYVWNCIITASRVTTSVCTAHLFMHTLMTNLHIPSMLARCRPCCGHRPHTLTHTHTHAHAQTQTSSHTHTHTHTHKHTHIHTHTHTHTHTHMPTHKTNSSLHANLPRRSALTCSVCTSITQRCCHAAAVAAAAVYAAAATARDIATH